MTASSNANSERNPVENPFDPELLIERHGAVRIVTLNRPEALNAVDPRLSHALSNVWAHLAEDADTRAVVLAGAGRAFSAGGDMIMFARIQKGHVERARLIEE